MESSYKQKEGEEKQEERRRKKQKKKEERPPEMEQKKEEIQKGAEAGMGFGESKPIIEVKYFKSQIPEMEKGVEKYEPIVKEELAVKLVQEEKKHEEIRKQEAKTGTEKTKETVKGRPVQRIIEEARSRKIYKLLKEAREKGLRDPVVDVAAELVKRELKKGMSPKLAVRKILLLLGKLKIIKISDLRSVRNALKKLIPGFK